MPAEFSVSIVTPNSLLENLALTFKILVSNSIGEVGTSGMDICK